MNPFVERHQSNIAGVLSCFDRVIITGTLPEIGHAEAMALHLSAQQVRLFDFPRWAEPLRDEIRAHAEQLAAEAGLEIEFIRSFRSFRKEERVKAILEERGDAPGLVHIFSAMESCPSYRPWHDKLDHSTRLHSTTSKCLHYYFYFVDELFGLCYLRVPTWAPFRLQVYLNGHHWLAKCLERNGIGFVAQDNAFLYLADVQRAQQLADSFHPRQLHQRLDRWAARFCPVLRHFRAGYHWSFLQVEYATDVLFCDPAVFQPLYEAIVRTGVHAVKADHVATFLGHKLTAANSQEVGNDFHTRIEGTRLRHHLGPASIKLYDKFARIARVECTCNDVSFFKHHRWVEQRGGGKTFKLASVRKSIYSLADLRELMRAANERYLAFIAAIDNPDAGLRAIHQMAKPIRDHGRSMRGFNLFLGDDLKLFLTIARGEWAITGLRAPDLRAHLAPLSASQASHLLKRLRTHGLLKKIGHRYKYYLTKLGQRVVATALVLREYLVLPSLAKVAA
jgi:hypothetical protein